MRRKRSKVAITPGDALAVEPLSGTLVQRGAAVDSLRAFACLLVVCSHGVALTRFENVSWRVWIVGQSGVVLFFVISGYLIAGPFARALVTGRELPTTVPYGLRRAARILPGWWIALAIAVAALPLIGLSIPGVPMLVAHLALMQQYIPAFERNSPLPVGWTLCLEAAFYIAVPLIAKLISKHRRDKVSLDAMVGILLVFWALALICGCVQDKVSGGGVPVGLNTLVWVILSLRFMGLFIPGIVLSILVLPEARGYRAGRALAHLQGRPGLAIGMACLGLGAAVAVRHSSHVTIAGMAYPLLSLTMAVILAAGLAAGPNIAAKLRWPARFGLLTYGLYLYHYTVGILIHHLGLTFDPGNLPVVGALSAWLVSAVALTIFTLPFALLSWLWVEKPAINWAARRSVAAPGHRAPRAERCRSRRTH